MKKKWGDMGTEIKLKFSGNGPVRIEVFKKGIHFGSIA